MNAEWKFDQAKNVAAVTSVHITKKNMPILLVSHYSDDHSWAFLSGQPITVEESQIVSMGEIVNLDPTVSEVASLKAGWSAERKAVGEEWSKYEDSEI